MLKLTDFDYHLPEENIAQMPAVPRDSSKLLLVDRQSGQISHHHFFDLPNLLDDSYVIVRNNTKVMPARIFGEKATGGKVELLLLKRIGIGEVGELWEVLSKPGVKVGQVITFGDGLMSAEVKQLENYRRLVEFSLKGEALFAALDQIGHTPIPPYIDWADDDEAHLREIYQTIYAKFSGSAAAPTAGLHFTQEVEQKLANKGIEIEEVTLHVGLGTFLPVKVEDVVTHEMHSESYVLTEDVAAKLNQAKKNGKKILAIGTTTTRLLEACTNEAGELVAGQAETNIYIFPPYKFKFVDAMVTNFHLPKSTLLMMISAFVSRPNTDVEFVNFADSLVGKAYEVAIKNGYRFYSFGDAMLILGYNETNANQTT